MTEQANAQAEMPAEPSTEVEESSEESQEVTDTEETEESEDVARETSEESDSSDESEPSAASHGKKKEIPKFKRKINGKEIEASEDELWKHYGLEVTSRERMEAAAKIKQEADQKTSAVTALLKKLETDPDTAFEILEHMGHDVKKLMRAKVLQDLEYERMSEAEREAYDNRKLVEEFKRKEELTKKQQAELQAKQEYQEKADQIDILIAESFKLSGLQPKRKTIARIAEACNTLLNASKTDTLPTPQQVVDKFLSYSRQDVSELMGEQDLDKLVELGLITDTFAEKVVKWHLAKNKKNLPSFSGSSSKQSQQPKVIRKKPVGVNEFFKKLGA